MVLSPATMRAFLPLNLAPYSSILACLQRIGACDGHRRAMRKGDLALAPLLA